MPPGGDKMNDEDIQRYLTIPAGEEQEVFIMKKVLVDAMPIQHRTLQALFEKHRSQYGDSKPLISLYDMTASGHYPVLLGAPGIRPDAGIAISLSPLTLDSNDTFPFRTGKPPHTGPDFKAIHAKAYSDLKNDWFHSELNGYWEQKLKDMGAEQEEYPSILHAFNALADHLVTLGIPEFEFQRSDLRPNVSYFGGLKKVGKFSGGELALPPWWDDIAKAKSEGKKIIAVSQGTVENNPHDLVVPTIKALEGKEDVLVIATFVLMEPEDVSGLVVPPNTRVARFVPYDLLLPMVRNPPGLEIFRTKIYQTDLLVSNGGFGAVQDCLRLGIPLVVAGEAQDKAITNALVQHTGVGLNLGTRRPHVEKIQESVLEILGNDSYKKRATALSKSYEQYDLGEVFDGLIGEVVTEWTKSEITYTTTI